jgi:hypothetical protein
MQKMKISKLPVEIMDKIVLETGDARIAHILRDQISQYALNRIDKNILIYGNIQGGKTNEIKTSLVNVFKKIEIFLKSRKY